MLQCKIICKSMHGTCIKLYSARYSPPPWLSVALLNFSHDRWNGSSPSFPSTAFQNFPGISGLFSAMSNFQHHTKLCCKRSSLLASSLNVKSNKKLATVNYRDRCLYFSLYCSVELCRSYILNETLISEYPVNTVMASTSSTLGVSMESADREGICQFSNGNFMKWECSVSGPPCPFFRLHCVLYSFLNDVDQTTKGLAVIAYVRGHFLTPYTLCTVKSTNQPRVHCIR